MGTWNGTCGITNLPIFKKEEAVLVLLTEREKRRNYGGGCPYPNDIFAPLCIPLYGKYDGSGSLYDVEDKSTIVFEIIKDLYNRGNLIVSEPDNKNFMESIEIFLQEVERGKVKLIDYRNQEFPIYFMLILRPVYDKTMEEGKQLQDFVGRSIDSWIRKQLEEYLVPENIHSFSSLEVDALAFLTYNCKLFAFPMQRQAFKEKQPLLREQIIELYLLNEVLLQARKQWSVQTGAGSDNNTSELQVKIAEQTLLLAKRKKR